MDRESLSKLKSCFAELQAMNKHYTALKRQIKIVKGNKMNFEEFYKRITDGQSKGKLIPNKKENEEIDKVFYFDLDFLNRKCKKILPDQCPSEIEKEICIDPHNHSFLILDHQKVISNYCNNFCDKIICRQL